MSIRIDMFYSEYACTLCVLISAKTRSLLVQKKIKTYDHMGQFLSRVRLR